MPLVELIGLVLALTSGARAVAEIPKIWREGVERKSNLPVLFENCTNIVDLGSRLKAHADKEVAISQSRNQRIVIGELSKTMRAIQEYQTTQNRDNNQTIRTMHNNQTAMQLSTNQLHQTMLNNQTILQLSAERLYTAMLDNHTRVLERIYADQVNQRTIFLCLTVMIAYFTYVLGVLQTENSWLRTMLLSTSTLQGLHVGQFVSPQLDFHPLRWLQSPFHGSSTWHTTVQVTQFVVVWGNRALGFVFTGFQLLKIWNIYNRTEHKRSDIKDALWMTLFCSPFRAVELFVRVAHPAPWIVFGCLLDCFFLYCHIMKSHRKLNGHTERVTSVAFSPDGTKIASGSGDRSVMIWDATSGRQLREHKGHIDPVYSVSFSPDGTRILSCSNYHSVRIWDVATGRQLQDLASHKTPFISVALSPDGTKIASGSDTYCSVEIRDASTGRSLQTHQGNIGRVTSVVFSPDGTKIAFGSDDRSVRIWDTATDSVKKQLNGHTATVRDLVFSPDGTIIASGSDDCSVRMWYTGTGRQLEELNGHTDSVRCVAFSPDGTKIASGSDDGSVRIWDVAARKQLREFNGHTGGVHSVVFSPDSTEIASGSDDHSIWIWNTAV